MAPPGAGPHDVTVVAVAASAGGITALKTLVDALPADFPAAVVIVQHLDPSMPSHLAHILERRGPLPVVEAQEGDVLEAAHVYVAPPGRHLLVAAGGILHLTDTPMRHFVRPSADELFESLAGGLDRQVVAVVLTGTGSDGAAGSHAVHVGGGSVVVQDPATSQFPGMPRAAIRAGAVTTVVPLDEIAGTLVGLLAREQPR